MNQFKHAWAFYINHWQYFLMLAAPVMAIEVIAAYMIMPLQNITQPEDMLEFFSVNGSVIGLVSLFGTILSISFTGGIYVAYDVKDKGEEIEPLTALFTGFKKFFPLMGAYILCSLAVFFSAFLLILPAFYITGRLFLFPAFIMLENKGVTESLKISWEKTDEHGGILFGLTLAFFSLQIASALLFQSFLAPGILQLVLLALVEYIIVVPWLYVYFSLYKSLRNY
tara:strand:- start:115 stop:789 length:675 start_codon:yes stop_codon:yes gene_type:complete